MTSATTSPDKLPIPHDEGRLVKRPDREWRRVIAAFAVVAAIMAALTLGQLGLAMLLRWIVAG